VGRRTKANPEKPGHASQVLSRLGIEILQEVGKLLGGRVTLEPKDPNPPGTVY
jgi:hypothetical protein